MFLLLPLLAACSKEPPKPTRAELQALADRENATNKARGYCDHVEVVQSADGNWHTVWSREHCPKNYSEYLEQQKAKEKHAKR
jgi:hypothetical protein